LKLTACHRDCFVVFSAYGPLGDSEQRRKYKKDFEAGSRVYNRIHDIASQTVSTFLKLEQKHEVATQAEKQVSMFDCCLQTSITPLKSQAKDTSLFTSAKLYYFRLFVPFFQHRNSTMLHCRGPHVKNYILMMMMMMIIIIIIIINNYNNSNGLIRHN
jgi:hypothetical protein